MALSFRFEVEIAVDCAPTPVSEKTVDSPLSESGM